MRLDYGLAGLACSGIPDTSPRQNENFFNYDGMRAIPPSKINYLGKMEFTVRYTRQITDLFTDISIKIHRFECIKQA
jgi:hypothetical protein